MVEQEDKDLASRVICAGASRGPLHTLNSLASHSEKSYLVGEGEIDGSRQIDNLLPPRLRSFLYQYSSHVFNSSGICSYRLEQKTAVKLNWLHILLFGRAFGGICFGGRAFIAISTT